MDYAQIGSVSHGTMNPQDTIPVFADELARLDKSKTFTELIKQALNIDWDNEEYIINEVSFIEEDLFDALNTFAPPYCYFGSHPGDGSDFGFWPSEYIIEDFNGLKVSDLNEVSKKYSGEVLHVNDHGNITLYSCKKGILKEIWSIV